MLSPQRKQLQAAAGLLLRLIRMSSGLEQERMASRLNVSQPTVSRWEKGRGGPSGKELTDWLMLCQVAMRNQPEEGVVGGIAPSVLTEARFNAVMRLLFQVYSPETAPSPHDYSPDRLLPEVRRMTQQLLLGQGTMEGPTGGVTLLERAPVNAPQLVPLYASIAAGLGEEQEPQDAARESLEVPRHILADDPGAYALRVRGDSMAPLLVEGDIVVISPARQPEEGSLVAAFVDPDGDVVKHFEWAGDSARARYAQQVADSGEAAGDEDRRPSYYTPEALLKPANPAYPVIRIGGELGRPARIWGRVVLMLREL